MPIYGKIPFKNFLLRNWLTKFNKASMVCKATCLTFTYQQCFARISVYSDTPRSEVYFVQVACMYHILVGCQWRICVYIEFPFGMYGVSRCLCYIGVACVWRSKRIHGVFSKFHSNLWHICCITVATCTVLVTMKANGCFLFVDAFPVLHLSHRMGKPTICIEENKGTDQLCRNCEADQHLCFRYMDSTIPVLAKSKISSL